MNAELMDLYETTWQRTAHAINNMPCRTDSERNLLDMLRLSHNAQRDTIHALHAAHRTTQEQAALIAEQRKIIEGSK